MVRKDGKAWIVPESLTLPGRQVYLIFSFSYQFPKCVMVMNLVDKSSGGPSDSSIALLRRERGPERHSLCRIWQKRSLQ